MNFFYRLLIAATLLPFFSLAQGNYKPGFVITLKGDTLKGYVDLKEWGNNPTNIDFKASLNKSAPQNFTVNDINYFEIDKIVAYRRFNTSISTDETNIQKLTNYRDTSAIVDNVFLKVEQTGKNVTLYSFEDDRKKRFYIYDHQNNNIAELIYRIYFVQNDKNNVATVSQNAYKQQLLTIAQKFVIYNDNIKALLEDANYNDPDLKLICRKINNTTKEEENTIKKTYVRFFAGAGISFNTITRTGTFPLYNSTPSHSSLSPKISLGFNFYPVPDVGKSVIRIEFLYTSGNYQTTGGLYYFQPDITTTYSFKERTYSVNPQFQYSLYNSDPFKFYINTGLLINFSQYTGNSVYNPVTNQNQTNYSGLNQHWLSVPLKAGIILKNHIDISLTYNFPISISDNLGGTHEDFNYSINLTSLQAMISYIF